MNKSLSCIFLAFTIFAINALPVQAARKKLESRKTRSQLVLSPGQWCFELPLMGLFCYDS